MQAFGTYEERPLPREALVPLLVEGSAENECVYVEPGEVTLFDFVASYRTAFNETPSLRDRPAIVSSATYDPDKRAEEYYYAKLLLHFPWSDFDADTGPNWLLPEDGGSHKKAFERLCLPAPEPDREVLPEGGSKPSTSAGAGEGGAGAEQEIAEAGANFFMRSFVFPKMNLAEAAWKELRRLNTSLVMRSAMQTPGAAEDWENHRELLRRLRLVAGHPDEEVDEEGFDSDVDDQVGAAPRTTSAFGPVHGGEEAVALLFGPDATQSKQQSLVYWFVDQVRQGSLNPARVLLHGPGGCGKTVAVRALATLLRQERHGVVLAAPTGCAAFLINGCTLHSCLHLPIDNNSYGRAEDAPPPSGPALQHLIEFWKPVRVLIIDEISMVSAQMLARIDCRLQIFKRMAGVPFGGLHIMICGDLYQLPPPRGEPVFAAETLWSMFLLCELEGNHRAAKDPVYASLLERVRKGVQTEEDVALLRTRMRRPPADSNAPHLIATRVGVAQLNEARLEAHAGRHQVQLFTSPAVDTSQSTGLPVEVDDNPLQAEDTGGLESTTRVAIGAKVMLRRNLDLQDGLVNGARGMVTDVLTDVDGQDVLRIRVEFDRAGWAARAEQGGAELPGVLISRVQGGFIGPDGNRIIRSQFPIVLSWGITIHKSQGSTEKDGIVLYLEGRFQSAQAYVGLSRVQCLEDLFLAGFDERTLVPAVGVDYALLQLQLAQAYQAQGDARPDRHWMACFASKDSVQALEKRIEETPNPGFAQTREELVNARAVELRGEKGDFACEHCGEDLGTKRALAHHKRRCSVSKTARKRPAGAPPPVTEVAAQASMSEKLREVRQSMSAGEQQGSGSAAPLPAPPPGKRVRLLTKQRAAPGPEQSEADDGAERAASEAAASAPAPPPRKKPRLADLQLPRAGAEAGDAGASASGERDRELPAPTEAAGLSAVGEAATASHLAREAASSGVATGSGSAGAGGMAARDVAAAAAPAKSATANASSAAGSTLGDAQPPARYASGPMALAGGLGAVAAAVAAYIGQLFRALETAGDGACSVHSVVGNPSGGMLRCLCARAYVRSMLGESAAELRFRAANDSLVTEALYVAWADAIAPQAKLFAGIDAGDHALGPEDRMIWEDLSADARLRNMCVDYVRHQDELYNNFLAKRMEVLDAFEPLCDRDFEDTFVRPLLNTLGLLEEYAEAPVTIAGRPGVRTKLDALFEAGPDGRKFRQGVLEYCGVENFHVLFDAVSDLVGAMLGDLPVPLFDFMEKLARARGLHMDLRVGRVPPFMDDLYPSYLDSMTKQTRRGGSYFLSPLELLLVCQCARKNVVIVKHDVLAGTLEYDRHVLPVPNMPLIFTSIRMRPELGPQARTHFERLECLPSAAGRERAPRS